MSKYLLFFGLILSLFMVACDNDVNIVDPNAGEQPVVYGILDVSSDYTYVRLEKTFVDATTGAAQLAKDPDEIYYTSARLTLTNKDNDTDVANLELINTDTFGVNRNPGDFAESPNYVYRLAKGFLNPDQTYILQVYNDLDEVIANSEVYLLNEIRITKPRLSTQSNLIALDDEGSIEFTFSLNDEDFDYFGYGYFYLDFVIFEIDNSTGAFLDTVNLTYTVAQRMTNKSVSVDGINIYNFFHDNLEVVPSVNRRIVSMYVTGEVFDLNFKTYLEAIDVVNSGVNATQDVPKITNIDGGLGLLSSKAILTQGPYQTNQTSILKLSENELTQDLNFIN